MWSSEGKSVILVNILALRMCLASSPASAMLQTLKDISIHCSKMRGQYVKVSEATIWKKTVLGHVDEVAFGCWFVPVNAVDRHSSGSEMMLALSLNKPL